MIQRRRGQIPHASYGRLGLWGSSPWPQGGCPHYLSTSFLLFQTNLCGLMREPMLALSVTEERVGHSKPIYLHMFKCSQHGITLEHMHQHTSIPRECGEGCGYPGRSAITTSDCMSNSLGRNCTLVTVGSMAVSVSISPWTEKCTMLSSDTYSPCSSGKYICPDSSPLSGSIGP